MKNAQKMVALALSGACLLVTVLLVIIGTSSQKLQGSLQMQQEEINKGSLSQQVGTSLLRDMGQVAIKNQKMRAILNKNGYNVSVNPPAPAASSTPAAK